MSTTQCGRDTSWLLGVGTGRLRESELQWLRFYKKCSNVLSHKAQAQRQDLLTFLELLGFKFIFYTYLLLESVIIF